MSNCKVLEIKPGTTTVEQDIVLEQANTVPVVIKDTEGLPLTGVWVTGISSQNWLRPVRTENDSCSAYHIEPGKPRLMVFYEPDKNLVGTLTLKGDEKEPAIAKLGPPGTATGRLVSEDNKPVTGGMVQSRVCDTRSLQLSGRKAQASVRCLFPTSACVLTTLLARGCEAGGEAQGEPEPSRRSGRGKERTGERK